MALWGVSVLEPESLHVCVVAILIYLKLVFTSFFQHIEVKFIHNIHSLTAHSGFMCSQSHAAVSTT